MQAITRYVGYQLAMQDLPPKLTHRVTTAELTQCLNTLKLRYLDPIERGLTVPHPLDNILQLEPCDNH